MKYKRDKIARAVRLAGITRLLAVSPKRQSLIVLNYHRIGDPDKSHYDPEVFSATVEDFEAHLVHFKRHYCIVSLEEALDFVEGRDRQRRSRLLITFDDGYLDNYQNAFPIMKSLGVPGVFFLATSLVGTAKIPWWDEIVYRLRYTEADKLDLHYPQRIVLPLGSESERLEAAATLLDLYKSPDLATPERLIEAIREASDISLPSPDKPRFLDWSQAREMIEGGMSIGSHTHSHRLIGHLSPEDQDEELRVSRQIIKDNLSVEPISCAYPVGAQDSFSSETYRALERTGYRCAFSYYGGVNLAGRTERFDIRRMSVDTDLSWPLFSLRLASAAFTGYETI